MSKATSEKLSTKLVDQVVNLIEAEFRARSDNLHLEDLTSWERKAKLKEEIRSKGNLPELLAAVDAANLAAISARAQVNKALAKLLPKGVKFKDEDNIDKQLDQLAEIAGQQKKLTDAEIASQRRKYVAKARMATTREQLDKLLKEIGLV